MERTVTFVCALWNPRKKVMKSTAETVEQLKAEMTANNISYENMSLFEGVSQTTLDSGSLPRDVMFKGKTTNDLVIAVSPVKQKIKSGASDREICFNYIKANNLNEAFKKKYGKSYTNASTEVLKKFVDARKKAAAPSTSNTKVKVVAKEVTHAKNTVDPKLLDATALTEAVTKIEEGTNTLKSLLNNVLLKSSFTDEDINRLLGL